MLLLRSLAIILLAFAFMRPYFRAQADLSLDEAPQRHIAVLIDSRERMKRGTLWEKAVDACERAVAIDPTYKKSKNNLVWVRSELEVD